MSSFSPDPALCQKYAQFASHLGRWQFKIIYWTMFFTNLAVLFIASWTYTKGQESLQKHEHDSRRRSRSLKRYIFFCLGCVCVSTTIVVMEAYALLALQFCDGEDLMSLYWSTWTMIQIGSLIAMVGIILALLHSLQNSQHPPWALALGTPVLVIAGFLHLFHECTKKRVKKMRKSSNASMMGPSMSEVNTIRVDPSEDDDNDMEGEFIGFTVDGGPIIRFTQTTPRCLDDNSDILGYCDGNRPIVAFRKDSIQFLTSAQHVEEVKRSSPLAKEVPIDTV